MGPFIAVALGLGACAPPPLPGADDSGFDAGEASPSIDFVFPHNGLDGTVCEDFFVSVDIDGFELVDFSDLHFRPDDELRYEVGRKTVTGNTDRWTLKFVKPAD